MFAKKENMVGGFISLAWIIMFSLLFCQMGALQNVPPPGNPLGMESGAIPDSSLTASSEYNPDHGPQRARLNISGEGSQVGAWCGGHWDRNVNQWIQVDLLTLHRITGVATQGRQEIENLQWVTSFKVACSVDGVAFENVKDIPNQPEADKVFTGNTDSNTVVYNTLPVAKVCRYVRLLPVTWNYSICLRMEIYGEPSPVTTQSSIDRVLDEVLNETVSEDNIEHLSEDLATVTKQSTNFDEGELLLVTEKLETIVNFTSEQNLTDEIVVQVSVSVIETVDNVLKVPETHFKTTGSDRLVSRDILASVSTLTGVIQRASTTNFTHRGSNIVVAAVKLDRMSFPLKTTIGGAGNDVIDFLATETVPSDMPGATSVSLPEAILPFVPGGRETIPLSIFLVKPSKLFRTDKSSPSSGPTPSSGGKRTRQPKTIATSVLASPILGVTVEGADIKDLPENESILFAFPINRANSTLCADKQNLCTEYTRIYYQ